MTGKTKDIESEAFDAGLKFADPVACALAILESVPGPAWGRIGELTAVHLHGQLSYEGWRTACGAILSTAAGDLER